MEYDKEIQALKEKYIKFQMLELPGQPQGMHMGTLYFVGDLMKMIDKLHEECKRRDHTVRT